MKSLLFVFSLLVVAVVVRCEPPPESKKAFEECRTELGLPDEKPKGPPNPDDPNVKCFDACIMIKTGLMVDDKIVPEKMIEMDMKHHPNFDDKMKDAINECANTANQQSDKCEVAGAMHKCIHENFGPPPHHKH